MEIPHFKPFKMRYTGTIQLIAPEGINAVRLALRVGGVAFDDTHASDQEPKLIVEGESLTQPQAMLRCAGRLGGSYPVASPTLALRVDEILHVLSEVDAKMKDGLNKHSESHSFTRLHCIAGSELFVALESATKLTSTNKHICEVELKVESHSRMQKMNENVCGIVPKLKLMYFPFPGRAEPIRLAFFIAGIPFEDERINADELERRRSSLPFNQIPVLAVAGELISQALAILRYAGTLGGLYSSTDYKESFRIDEVFSLVDEFYCSYIWNASYYEKDPAKQMMLRTTLAECTLPRTLEFLETRVGKWKGLHAVGMRFTVADLAIYSLLWTFKSGRIAGAPVSVVDPFKNLLQVHQTVATHPKVVEWTALSR
ncbi:unnamed protein product [Phytophthora fragariaefolia]|uniref:Unnamed protein product n=1 Tax=Phytophthora fragariaefolia TaxID=1490495 RepID=A0A9W6XQG9_9STRA|nr:unnamed protein product [Phytophthora fragariaefolia]